MKLVTFGLSLAAALLIAIPVPAADDSSSIARQIFGQIVAFELPDTFHVAYTAENASSYLLESVPAGESVDAWKTMITITASHFEPGKEASLGGAAQALANHYWQACTDSFKGTSLGGSVSDGYDTLTTFMGCGTVQTPQGAVSETAVILFLKGPTAIYSVQWARHEEAVASPIAYRAEDWRDPLRALASIRLCDPVGEEAPYPTCR